MAAEPRRIPNKQISDCLSEVKYIGKLLLMGGDCSSEVTVSGGSAVF